MKLIPLEEQYKQHLNKFKKTSTHPHPSELLSLLLLPEKDKYLSLTGNVGDFYNYYKEEIDKKITQVMTDFDITEEDILEYTNIYTVKEFDELDYERTKIWQVFANGFIVVQWGIMFHPDWSPERMHNAFSKYWGRKPIPDYLIEDANNVIKLKPQRKIRRRPNTSIATKGFNWK